MAAAAEHTQTPGEYIIHHLTHFGTGKPKGLVDFSVINFDSVVFSAVIGAFACFLLWRAARKATSGVPGRFQAAVEMLFELVDNEAKGIIHNAESRKMVAPLALTVFVWIFLLNAMEVIPQPEVLDSLRLFAREVMPAFDQAAPRRMTGRARGAEGASTKVEGG